MSSFSYVFFKFSHDANDLKNQLAGRSKRVELVFVGNDINAQGTQVAQGSNKVF